MDNIEDARYNYELRVYYVDCSLIASPRNVQGSDFGESRQQFHLAPSACWLLIVVSNAWLVTEL